MKELKNIWTEINLNQVKLNELRSLLSFVERSESGADDGNVRPRALVLGPAIRDETDEQLVISLMSS